MTTSTFNALKTAVCESISGRSTLTYELTQLPTMEFAIRITHNTGNGYFCDDWLELSKVQELDKGMTAYAINQLFHNKSANTGGFLIAALKQEGFIQLSEQSKRAYVLNPESTLIAELQQLASHSTSKQATKSSIKAKTGRRKASESKGATS